MGRYGIGALARQMGCSVETVRYYERIGLMPEPPRTSGRHRSYSDDDLGRLTFIVRSRKLGFPIKEIRQLLALCDDGSACEEVQAITLDHIRAIRSKISDLEHLVGTLQLAASACEGAKENACPIIDTLFDRHPGQGPGKAH